MKRPLISLLFLFMLVFVIGCSSSDKGTPPFGTIDEDPSFSDDIAPIFASLCSNDGCHSTRTASAGLVLESNVARTNLVNISATSESGKTRVIPGNSTDSYVIIKLEGRQNSGSKMPLTGSISGTQIQLIKNWIDQGAKNN